MRNSERIRRPALKYYGGKWRLAPWIISHFPPHNHYIEPCFGGGSVLLRKPPSDLESVNDLNGRVVNFFKILRDRPNDLIRLIDLTPWAQEEYDLSKIGCDDSLEDARQFFIMSWMSINGAPLPTGFRIGKTRGGRGTVAPQDIINHSLYKVAKRIKSVQITNLDAIEFLNKFSDDPNSLIYFDPPYLSSTRTGRFYGEWDDFDKQHKEAAEILRNSPAYIIVSGYICDEYYELYEEYGWTRVDKKNRVQNNKKRTESLWLSPNIAQRVEDYR